MYGIVGYYNFQNNKADLTEKCTQTPYLIFQPFYDSILNAVVNYRICSRGAFRVLYEFYLDGIWLPLKPKQGTKSEKYRICTTFFEEQRTSSFYHLLIVDLNSLCSIVFKTEIEKFAGC